MFIGVLNKLLHFYVFHLLFPFTLTFMMITYAQILNTSLYSVRVDVSATSVVTNDVPCHTTIVSVPSVPSLVADGTV